MRGRLAGLGGVLAIVGGLACGAAAAAEKNAGAVPSFAGRWRLDKTQSDDEAAKLAAVSGKDERRQAEPAKAPGSPGVEEGKGAGGRGSAAPNPAVAHVDDDPRGIQRKLDLTDEITIAQNEVAIAVTDKAGQTRDFYPNGKAYKADDGGSEVTSAWRDGALVFEKKAARGWKRRETWQLTPDKRLRVEIRIEGGGRPKVQLTQVYDRVVETP